MAQPKLAFVFEGNSVCMQCHRPVSSDEKFCSKVCKKKYWQEFQDFVFVTSDAATMNTGSASKEPGDMGRSSEIQGHTPSHHTTSAHHGGSSTTLVTDGPNSNTDSRGVLRGQCTACGCSSYFGGTRGLKCLNCNHPPGKHQNLTSPTSPSSSAASLPRPSQAAAVPPNKSISANNLSLSAASHPSFSVGPHCQFPGCTQEAHFDLNTGSQYSFCQQHQTSLPAHLQTMSLTGYEDDYDSSGEMISPPTSYQPQTLSIDPSSSWLPPQAQPQQPQVPYAVPGTLGSQSVPNFATAQPVPQQPPPQPSLVPQGPPPPQPPAAPLKPQPAPTPAVPPDQQCKLPGCTRRRFTEKSGKMHDCCGKTHALEYTRQQEKGSALSADFRCQTPGCPRKKRKKDDGSGYFDYCSLTCRNKGQMSASVPKDLALQERGTCTLPGCTRPKYMDPANGRVHDFCGRTHAYEAQQRGISVDIVNIRVANSREFQTISVKFKKDWVKGQCPSVSHVFVITNTPLGKRYDAYRKKLSNQTQEQHYHGTKLKCNITQDRRACSDSDCGICGISSMGLDRRCIQKNISFQRFGHGFYLAPNSSKCHDYTQGAYNFRAMLLCEVAPGNKYFLQKNDTSLKGPPQGFDSVYGKGAAGSASVLNYDEIVIYNPDCILPRYIIIYQRDGTHKIAS